MIVTFFPRKLEQNRIFYEIMETVGRNPFAGIIIDESRRMLAPFVFNIDQVFKVVPSVRPIFQIATNDGRLMKLLSSEVFMVRIIDQIFMQIHMFCTFFVTVIRTNMLYISFW